MISANRTDYTSVTLAAHPVGGSCAWKLAIENVCVGSFVWECSLENFRSIAFKLGPSLEAVVLDLSFGNVRFATCV